VHLFQTKKLNKQTLVWQKDWMERHPLGRTSITTQQKETKTGVPTPVMRSQSVVSSTVAGRPKVNPGSLNTLFWWWFGTTLFQFPLYVMSFSIDFQDINLILLFLIFICILLLNASGILKLILVYKLWNVIQDGYASTTPGKAIGFLFIPYFSIYWIIRVYYGLAQDLNEYIKRQFRRDSTLLHRTHPGIAFTFTFYNWGVYIFTLLYSRFVMTRETINIHNLYDFKTLWMAFWIPAMILASISLIVEMVMFFDLLSSAKSIRVAEESKK
jgi:hypothetical protein